MGMPHYFLHLRGGDLDAVDTEGMELPDLDAAREEAIGTAREIAADRLRYGRSVDLGACFVITNEVGRTLLKVPFSDAIVILPPQR